MEFDAAARQYVADSIAFDGELNLFANQRQAGDGHEYDDKESEQRSLLR